MLKHLQYLVKIRERLWSGLKIQQQLWMHSAHLFYFALLLCNNNNNNSFNKQPIGLFSEGGLRYAKTVQTKLIIHQLL